MAVTTLVLSIAVAAASAVLLGAGVAKLLQPEGTVAVLAALGAPAPTTSARLLAAYEVVLGAATLAFAGRVLPALVGLTYAAAAGTVLAARRAGLGSCGCFGSRSPAPRALHAVVDLACAGVAGAGAVVGVDPVADTLTGRSVAEVALILAATVGTAAALVVAVTAAPRQRI